MTRSTRDVSPGDHVCAVPLSEEQLWEVSADFVADGLDRNERVLYFDDGTAEGVLNRLSDDHVAFERPLRTGQLAIVPPEATRAIFHTTLPEARAMMLEHIDGSTAAGYAGFRMTGQMSHGVDRQWPATFVEYDRELDRLVRERGITALCVYDRRRYSDEQIERMRDVHRKELSVPTAYDDGLLRVVRTGPTSARLAGEVDHSNRPAIARLLETTLDDALRSHSAPTDIELNLASLRFIDVASAVSLVHAAEGFPDTHRLVLIDVRPGVLRVLDRCGAPFAAQLTVREFEGSADGALRGPGPVAGSGRHAAGPGSTSGDGPSPGNDDTGRNNGYPDLREAR
ncbi:MAG: MEDS domain-containing protein [Pseudonocardia sp.]|nr:MEDS domain-containing protein [Pseudonocardia sp.]ODU11278.1 MAG: anti-sigma-factor [Pseudonocardia sp. SCN 72-51]ODV04875.1 MAG: anti-sigma-factor [Pseudonocardia sp. SCN 73-27]